MESGKRYGVMGFFDDMVKTATEPTPTRIEALFGTGEQAQRRRRVAAASAVVSSANITVEGNDRLTRAAGKVSSKVGRIASQTASSVRRVGVWEHPSAWVVADTYS